MRAYLQVLITCATNCLPDVAHTFKFLITMIFVYLLGHATSLPDSSSLATFCLLLPGKQLHLSALLSAKKFRGRGNKEAALLAFRELERAELGNLVTQDSRRGTSAVSLRTTCTKQNKKRASTSCSNILYFHNYSIRISLPFSLC